MLSSTLHNLPSKKAPRVDHVAYLTLPDSVSNTPSDSPAEASSHLQLFSQPHSRLPATLLRSAIAIVSRELFDSFLRRSTMTVWDVVRTKFDDNVVLEGKKGVGSREGVAKVNRKKKIGEWDEYGVLYALGPEVWERTNSEARVHIQILLLHGAVPPMRFRQDLLPISTPATTMCCSPHARSRHMRSVDLIGRGLSGMDEIMVRVSREYLRGDSSSTSKPAGGEQSASIR
ncbi:hypothetical protein EV359DRAFT_87749 [Lentinula novae-zelandiae]|nr:hypothetical protein EV359DRAFT_87749 [Lentinula novae-zelandiae]